MMVCFCSLKFKVLFVCLLDLVFLVVNIYNIRVYGGRGGSKVNDMKNYLLRKEVR